VLFVLVSDGPNLHQLIADMDDALFARIQANEHHVLQQLLPAPTWYKYVINMFYAAEDITIRLHQTMMIVILLLVC